VASGDSELDNYPYYPEISIPNFTSPYRVNGKVKFNGVKLR